MPIKTGYWIRLVDGQVEQVWDYRPSQEILDAEPGWEPAVEDMPDVIPNREVITTHTFDLTTKPLQIVWGKRGLTIDERKDNLVSWSKDKFQKVIKQELLKELDTLLETEYNAATVEDARLKCQSELSKINELTTHEEIDAFESSMYQ